MADRQALGAAREIQHEVCTIMPGIPPSTEEIAEIISKHYSAKLEAAQKMAEALAGVLAKFPPKEFLPGSGEGKALTQAEAALAAWKATQ